MSHLLNSFWIHIYFHFIGPFANVNKLSKTDQPFPDIFQRTKNNTNNICQRPPPSHTTGYFRPPHRRRYVRQVNADKTFASSAAGLSYTDSCIFPSIFGCAQGVRTAHCERSKGQCAPIFRHFFSPLGLSSPPPAGLRPVNDVQLARCIGREEQPSVNMRVPC